MDSGGNPAKMWRRDTGKLEQAVCLAGLELTAFFS